MHMHKQVSVQSSQIKMGRFSVLERACQMIDADINSVKQMIEKDPDLINNKRVSIANFGDEILVMSL